MRFLKQSLNRIIAVIFIFSFMINIPIANIPGNSYAAPVVVEKAKKPVREKNERTTLNSNSKTDIIVKYKDTTKTDKTQVDVKNKLKLKKMNKKSKFESLKMTVIEIDATDDINKVIKELKNDPNVEYAQPNYQVTISTVDNSLITSPSSIVIKDMYPLQWSLFNNGQEVEGKIGRVGVDINVNGAWNLNNNQTVIGVLDSGIDITHPDLQGKIYVNTKEIAGNEIDDDKNGYIDDINGWNFSEDTNVVFNMLKPYVDEHGTYVAGIIGALNNNLGITGVADNVKIAPLKFINGNVGYTCDILEAIEYAKNNGIKIINCSFGSTDNNIALKEAMRSSGILFICAAGNRGSEAPFYPASFDLDNVLSVGSIDSMGVLAVHSNRGTSVDICAPGTNILSTVPNNQYEYFSGTSAASAIVAGVAVLVANSNPAQTPLQIKNKILNTSKKADNLTGLVVSGGRVNATAAVTGQIDTTKDTYNGAGAGDDVMINTGTTTSDSWYTQDQYSAIKERLHYGENGVNPASGNYSLSATDMSIPAPGFQVNFSRTYNSKSESGSLLGRGWNFGFEGKLIESGSIVDVCLPDGSYHRFTKDGLMYKSVDTRASFVKNGSEGILTTKDQYKYGFDATGRMYWMADKNGNKLEITYNGSNKIATIKDTVNRVYTIGYNALGLISTITDPESRVVTYEYTNQLLTKVIDPNGGVSTYTYNADKMLETVLDANNATMIRLEYSKATETFNKVIKSTDILGDTWNYVYNAIERSTTVTNTDNRKWTYWYDQSFYTIKVQDPEGRFEETGYYFTYNKNTFGDVSLKIDRNGNRTLYDRDNNGNILKVYYDDQSTQSYKYDLKNNMIQETNQLGRNTFYEYNDKNQLTKKLEPLNGTDNFVNGTTDAAVLAKFAITTYEYYSKTDANTKFACNVEGLLNSETDPMGVKTTYKYNQYGDITEIAKVKDINGNVYKVTRTYNKIGWKLTETSAKGDVFQWKYDKNGSVIRSINPDGGTTVTVIDKAGQVRLSVLPKQYVASLDNPTTNVYTGTTGTAIEYYSTGLMKSKTDALGNKTSFEYDKYGNIVKEIQPNGGEYRYQYDILNRKTKTNFYSPTNNLELLIETKSYAIKGNGDTVETTSKYATDTEMYVSSTTSDFAGRIIEQSYPDATRSLVEYNLDGTIKFSIGQNGATTEYTYDARGRLSVVIIPSKVENGATYYTYKRYTYDNANKKLTESTGIDLVLKDQAPLTYAITTYTYNNFTGQLTSTVDADGRTTSLQYDANGNINKETVKISGSQNKVTDYTHNYMNKPLTITTYVRKGDIAGNLLTVNTQMPLKTSYTYDLNGNVETETNPSGEIKRIDYDVLNREIAIQFPTMTKEGTVVPSYIYKTYNSMGLLETDTDALGNKKTYGYNMVGALNKVEETVGAEIFKTIYTNDRMGRRILEISPENTKGKTDVLTMNRVLYTYDGMNRVKSKTAYFEKQTLDSQLNWVKTWTNQVIAEYEYDAVGNIISEKDGNGNVTRKTYTLAGQLETVLDAENAANAEDYYVKNTYNGLGQLIKEEYANDNFNDYTYNNNGNKLTTKIDNKLVETITYDLIGNPLTIVDGNNKTTTYTYNALGFVSKQVTPTDSSIPSLTTTFQYDVKGNLINVVDSLGQKTIKTYSPQGKVISIKTQNSDGTKSITVLTAYDQNGNICSQTDGNGNVSKMEYDSLNRLKKTTNSKNQVKSFTYDQNGNKLTETDYLGNTTTYKYDGINRLIQVTDAVGAIISRVEYDASNNQIRNVDAAGNSTYYTFDKNNREISRKSPKGSVTSQTYDVMGNISSKTDGLGHLTTYRYNKKNLLEAVFNALGESTSYVYDNNNNVTSMTDGKGNVTSQTYNVANLMTQRIDPNGKNANGTYINEKTEIYTYTANGKLKTKKDRNGVISTYTYDIFGRLESEVVGSEIKSYTYDNNSNVLTMTDATGVTTRTYDSLNRVLTKTVPNFEVSQYTYDLAATNPRYSKSSTKDPKGNITETTYDELGRIKEVTNNSPTEKTTYTYTPTGNRDTISYPNGATEKYTYSVDNQLLTLVNKKANGNILQSYAYDYDAAGNQKIKTDEKGLTSYEYDYLNRLVKVLESSGKVTSYTFDRVGNRSSEIITLNGTLQQTTTYTYNDQNRLLQTETVSGPTTTKTQFVYDFNGNLKTKKQTSITAAGSNTIAPTFTLQKGLSNTISIFTYDAFNRLTELQEGSKNSKYKYNAEDYRVEKLTSDTNSTQGAITTRYLYEGDKVVLETDQTGKEVGRNVYGINLIKRIANTNNVVQSYYYMYNGHADVTALINEAGTIVATYYYDAFGNVLEETGNANNSITYAGYQYDKESGLYYLNARYYDSKTARFLTEDTYRGQANDPLSLNLYTYTYNNPISYSDPSGHIVTDWDRANMNENEVAAIDQYTKNWETANAKNKNAKSTFDKDDSKNDMAYWSDQAKRLRDAIKEKNNIINMNPKPTDKISMDVFTLTINTFWNNDRCFGAITDISITKGGSTTYEDYWFNNPLLISIYLQILEKELSVTGSIEMAELNNQGIAGMRKNITIQSGLITAGLSGEYDGNTLDALSNFKYKNNLNKSKDYIIDSDLIKALGENNKKQEKAYLKDMEGYRLTKMAEQSGLAEELYATTVFLAISFGEVAKQSPDKAKSDALEQNCEQGNCFIAGTLILTKDGYKNIEDIKVGEEVYSQNTETSEIGFKKVKQTFIRECDVLIHVTIGEETIVTTPTHPFWVIGTGWVEAIDLRVNDIVLLSSGDVVRINDLKTEELSEPVFVYNFEVSDWHSYFVTDLNVLVHNANYSEGTGNSDYSSWNQGSFKNSGESLEYHFKKHGTEVNAKDIDQYLRKAETFKINLRGATKRNVSGTVDGVIRYVKNGKYIDLAPDGSIVSFGVR